MRVLAISFSLFLFYSRWMFSQTNMKSDMMKLNILYVQEWVWTFRGFFSLNKGVLEHEPCILK